jgi:hypothetical protein
MKDTKTSATVENKIPHKTKLYPLAKDGEPRIPRLKAGDLSFYHLEFILAVPEA